MESAGQKTSGGESSLQLSFQYGKVIIFQRQSLYWEDFLTDRSTCLQISGYRYCALAPAAYFIDFST